MGCDRSRQFASAGLPAAVLRTATGMRGTEHDIVALPSSLPPRPSFLPCSMLPLVCCRKDGNVKVPQLLGAFLHSMRSCLMLTTPYWVVPTADRPEAVPGTPCTAVL